MYQLILVVATAVLVALDQITKYLAVHYLYPHNTVSVWDGVIEFCYCENRGIAWGLLQDKRWLVLVATGVMLAFVLAVLMTGRFKSSKLISVGGVLVLAGGIGNLIDRILNGFVIDFIHYYKWFDFPVFNFADCCVTIGAVTILIYVFFFGSKDKPKEEIPDATVPLDTDSGTDEQTP
ncbi:MAG: signal peptidase II [Clostridia bacterium]|nr:signal peptidase II [Clostridia bacterium]